MNLSRTCRWMPLALPILIPATLSYFRPVEQTTVCTMAREPQPRLLDRALMEACQSNDFEEARALLKSGADPNARDSGEFPLFFSFLESADPGDARALGFLLQHGADANARWGSASVGTTPLMWAASMNGGARAVELLLAHGARAEDRDEAGQTALIRAARLHGSLGSSPSSEEALALIKHGANVNAQDLQGNTPLLLVLSGGSDDIHLACALLARGASLNHRNHAGRDARQLAQQMLKRLEKQAHSTRGESSASYKYLQHDPSHVALCQDS